MVKGRVSGLSWARAQMVGAWYIWSLFLIFALFNTFPGEELLFRSLLLPSMNRAFGTWDWEANGALFGCYHLHQPWRILAVVALVLFAYPSKRFRCAWFGIIAHSGQSVFFTILILGLVLGLAKTTTSEYLLIRPGRYRRRLPAPLTPL